MTEDEPKRLVCIWRLMLVVAGAKRIRIRVTVEMQTLIVLFHRPAALEYHIPYA